jgi:hypothetical protein
LSVVSHYCISFWYEEALKQFQSIAAADPQCAMARWAIAMTEWRPFWDGLPDERRKAGVAEIDKAPWLFIPGPIAKNAISLR